MALDLVVFRLRHARRHGGLQEVLVGGMAVGGVEARPRRHVDLRTPVAKGHRHLLHPPPHLRIDRGHVVIDPDGHLQVLERAAVKLRQVQTVAPRHDVVRPGHGQQGGLQVRRRTGQRADHGNVRLAAHVPRRRVAAHPEQVPSGLVAKDAAEVRRVADGPADVGAGLYAGEARRQRRRRPARGAAGNALQIVGIVGGAVDVVIALKICQHQRHVGLAEHHRASRLQPAHRLGVLSGDVVLPIHVAPSGGGARQVVGLLHRHRHPVQGTELAAFGDGPVGGARIVQSLLAHVHHQRVEFAVVAVHPVQVVPQQLLAADRLGADSGRQFGCGKEGDVAHGGFSKWTGTDGASAA